MTENQTKPETERPTLEEQQLAFEKFKSKIELFKWLIGSVALVLVTMVIDYGFRDRAAGLQEIQQYDKYITDLIVLNKEPGQKRMLAQFFAKVTPSKKLKQGWVEYYCVVDSEYQQYIAPVLRNDSIIRVRYDSIIVNFDSYSVTQKKELEVLKSKIEDNNRLINPDIILPSATVTKDHNAAMDWESKGFTHLLAKDVDNAIIAFRNSENAYNSFHQVYEIAKYLTDNKSSLKEGNSEFWKTAFHKIANDFSWKMPDDVRDNLLEAGKK